MKWTLSENQYSINEMKFVFHLISGPFSHSKFNDDDDDDYCHHHLDPISDGVDYSKVIISSHTHHSNLPSPFHQMITFDI